MNTEKWDFVDINAPFQYIINLRKTRHNELVLILAVPVLFPKMMQQISMIEQRGGQGKTKQITPTFSCYRRYISNKSNQYPTGGFFIKAEKQYEILTIHRVFEGEARALLLF